MDTNFWNKVAIVVFIIIILLWLLVMVSDTLFKQTYPSQSIGYYLPSSSSQLQLADSKSALRVAPIGSQPASDGAGKVNLAKQRAELAQQRQELDALFAKADVARGRLLFQQCALCHGATKNSANRLGPSLWQVVDRPIASLNNFKYSDIMLKLGREGKKWDEDTLFAFLKSPRQYAPGTFMAFFGIAWPQDRANLIAYLRSLTDKPQTKLEHR